MIDLPTAKAHLRVDTTAEDGLITIYLNSAIAAIKKRTSKLFAPDAVSDTFASFPASRAYPCGGYGHAGTMQSERPIRLSTGPVYAGTAGVTIKYDDISGVEQTLTDFRLIDGSNPLLLPAYGSSWPFAQNAAGSVRIGYTAGYSDTDGVPPELDQAVLMLIGHYYENRNAVEAGLRAAAVEIPQGVEALIADYCPPGIA